jgi:hypothetical protein
MFAKVVEVSVFPFAIVSRMRSPSIFDAHSPYHYVECRTANGLGGPSPQPLASIASRGACSHRAVGGRGAAG